MSISTEADRSPPAPPGKRVSGTEFQSGIKQVLLEIIAPALLMLMLGSLFFFFLEIMYRGRHELPIHWVFGLYIFAIVLIGRISVEESFTRARLFAIPLMIAVFIQTGFGPHWILVFAAWWAASKLTWDCTFIDESRDVTGQGLISAAAEQVAKLRTKFGLLWHGKQTLGQMLDESKSAADEAESASRMAKPHDSSVGAWMKELLWKRKRKNTPGLWTFFFFVAGLALFAFGQLFVSADERARDYNARLFAIYLFAGLGLMMFISLVGLFRYLRQRGAEMPDSIARAWLAMGTVVAIVFVAIVLYLPWPNSGVSLSSLLPRFQTANRTGDRSPLTERGKAEGPQGQGKPDEKGAPGTGDRPSEKEGPGGVAGGEKTGSQIQGKPGDTSGGQQPGGEGPKPSSGQSQSSSSNTQQNKSKSQQPPPPQQNQSGQPQPQPQSQSQSNSSQPSNQKQGQSQQPSESGKNSGQASSGQNKSGQQSQSSAGAQRQKPGDSNQRAESKNNPPSESGKRDSAANQNQSSPPPPPKTPAEARAKQRASEQQQQQQAAKNSATPSTPPPASAASWLQTIMDWLKSAVSVLIWLVGLILGCWLVIRFRNQIIDGLTQFFESLRRWIAGWFSPKRPEDAAENQQTVSRAIPQTPFSAFRNPFEAAGKSHSPVEIVEYSFAALESLAREAGIPRMADETPLEFSRRIADRHQRLGRGARELAELYSQVAYAAAMLDARTIEPLRGFWAQMQAFAQSQQPAAATP